MVRTLLRSLAGMLVKSRARVTVGPESRVNWLRVGARGGGTLVIGERAIVECRVSFDAPGTVRIGDRSYIGASQLVCHTGIDIGNDVIISWGVTIVDHNSHALDWAQRRNDIALWREGRKDWDGVAIAPVVIEDKVWIGFGASILKGVRLGTGAIVGAQAVVTRDVAPFTVVAGNPARVIRDLTPAERV
jgi:acetyltransferase-like isoleucine patch superfamily enzyme